MAHTHVHHYALAPSKTRYARHRVQAFLQRDLKIFQRVIVSLPKGGLV